MENETTLDHVILFADDLAITRRCMQNLGFHTTDRADHRIFGTANHLIVFESFYLELLGIVNARAEDSSIQQYLIRQKAQSRSLVSGMALGSTDIELSRAGLAGIGAKPPLPQTWSRQAPIDGGSDIARFSTLGVPQDASPLIKTLYCQHHTPQLVFRPKWQRHGNLGKGVRRICIPASRPGHHKDRYRQLMPGNVVDSVSNNHLRLVFRSCTIEFIDEREYADVVGSELGIAPLTGNPACIHVDVQNLAGSIEYFSRRNTAAFHRDGKLIVSVNGEDSFLVVFSE